MKKGKFMKLGIIVLMAFFITSESSFADYRIGDGAIVKGKSCKDAGNPKDCRDVFKNADSVTCPSCGKKLDRKDRCKCTSKKKKLLQKQE